ncbi:MAG TPA: hypothetical protein VN026_00800 [Bacteroidia bacterium]|jgi:hypothetical protein|nr:hypothetical protein [Bacteroidia bacterium]
MEKKVKNILLRLNLEGYGIVNYDSNDQKYILNEGKEYNKDFRNNSSYAKKTFYNDENGKQKTKIKISKNCLKQSIFKKDIPFQCPNIVHDDILLYSFIGSPASMLRGFLFAKEEAFKRKEAFSITDAEQSCNAISNLETFTRSGQKNTDEDVKDNSFFKKETVGDIKYSAHGNIDLEQLQFVSTDPIFDRLTFNPDKFNLFSKFMKQRMESFKSELGYYKMKTSVVEIPEYGFKFSNEDMLHMVKYLFNMMMELTINRNGGYAVTSELQYKLVYNPLEDTRADENGWVSVKTQKDIDKLDFSIEDFYVVVDEEESKKMRSAILDNYQVAKKKTADKKESKKPKKKDKEEVAEAEATV